MHELTQLIKEDMRPALGVTEPGAIAYAVSKAKSYVAGELEEAECIKTHIHAVFRTVIFTGMNTRQRWE